jgi:hypothetical protein
MAANYNPAPHLELDRKGVREGWVGYQIALVTCQFERTLLDIKVVFDSQNQIAGLFFVQTNSK